jgi:hypothetical protein
VPVVIRDITRETVNETALSINLAKCWNGRCILHYSFLHHLDRYSPNVRWVVMVGESSDNVTGAANQQERLDAYIAGFVDGEGSFHVAIQRNPWTRAGWQLVPEFRVSQDVSRAQILDLIQARVGCGSIRENHRGSKDHTMVLVVRKREYLLERVIPFFERNPLLSCKNKEFLTFAGIVREMAKGAHLEEGGFQRLAALATQMNGGGRYRRLHNSSAFRILRDHTPGTTPQKEW